jgi:DNA-binding transcriptional LysR family regulator
MTAKKGTDGQAAGHRTCSPLFQLPGAEFVGLQRIENPQHLGWIAPDRQIVDRGVVDDVVGIDDKRGAQRDALVLVQHAESSRKFALHVGQHRDRQRAKIVVVLPVARDAFLIALPPDHRLADEEQIPVSALATERLLLLEDGHCLRDQALAVFGLLAGDRRDRDGFAATSLHTLVQMVASGLGVTLLPKLAVAAGITEGTGLVLRPLAGPGARRTLGLAWRPNAPRSADGALGSHLVDTCRETLER